MKTEKSSLEEGRTMKCEYCERPATKVAYYGDESTIFGGGQGTVYTCDDHVSPCNLPADPHASFDREERLPTTMTAQDTLTALDWMDEDGSATVHCRNRIVSREAIDLWADGHSWTAADVDGQVVVTRDDGVTANVWIDESGVLQAVEV